MANNNNEGAENSPDNSKDAGLDKSFVGKFVSGLFNSTPLSKWFGKDSASKSVKRREDDDDDDDDDFDASYVFQPPSKRVKLPSEVEHNNYSAHIFESPVTVHNASNNVNNVSSKVFGKFPEPVAGPSGVKSRKLFDRHRSASTNTVSTNSFENQEIVNGENDSDSEESTSGYSSAPKLLNQPKSAEISHKETCEKVTPKTRSLFTSSNESSGRTLFSERSPNMNTSLSSRRPSFNASTFGSPNFIDRTLSTKRILSSPFYSGNTIYGGASAYGRRLGKISEETNSRVSVQIKPVNEKPPSENATLSKTARRILSTLEQYSTPISDAKKIPVTPRRPGLLSSYVGATPYLVRDRKRPSNKELQVPSVPDLLQMKQKERLQNSTETVRQIATKSKSSLNKEEYKIRTEEDNKQKHSNKMKSSVASVRQKVPPIEPVSEVKLPKVSLPISTLPKFDFVLMPPSNSSETTKNQNETKTPKSPVSTVIKPTVIVDKKETEKKIVENGKSSFTFSEPLVISKDLKSVTAINCFKFSEPVCKKQSTHTGLMFKSAESKSEIKPKNNGENVPSIAKPASQLSTGSVMDVLKKPPSQRWECPTCLVRNDIDKDKCCACDEPKPQPEKKETKGFGEQFKMSSDKWECNSCMVRNNNSDKTCVACGSSKAGEDKPVAKSGFGDAFKPPASTWECTSCLIRNKNELESCAACGASKTPSGSFGDKFKPSGDTWECATCMIRNKNTVDKCAACETPKPGAKPTSVKPMTAPIFSFGIKQEWECKTCLIKNKNELTQCAACEMPRESETEKKGFGDAFKMKGGEWECSSCLVKNKPTDNVCVCCGVAKSGGKSSDVTTGEKKPLIGFNFGIDKSNAPQFKFGIPSTSSELKASTTSAPPTFAFGDAAKSTAVTSSSFSFGINTQEKVTPTNTVTSSENVTVASNPLLKPSEKLPEKATPAPVGFKFGLDKTQESVVTSSSDSTNKTETPTTTSSFGTKPAPMFQFKPPAVNGDIKFGSENKDKPVLATEPVKESPFSAEPKNQDSPFGSKTQSSPFATAASKPQESPFGTPSKPTESPFVSNKPADLPFGSASKPSDSPFGSASKPKDSLFGNVNKPSSSLFGNTDANKPKESIFGSTTEPNKPQAGLFTTVDTNKPQETLFGGDANKPKGATPTFTFTPKPPESAPSLPSAAPAAGIFKFGGATASPNQLSTKRAFDEPADNNVTNGFGSVPKIPAFGASQSFGTSESKPFAFESAPKNAGFSFGQAEKPNTTPVFNFGSAAAGASSAPNTGFSFSVPSAGFNFGGAPKVESQPFNAGGSVFGTAGPAAKNGSFNFGTNANNNNQKAVFSFGANQTNPPPSQPSFPSQGQSQPGFNFGAPTQPLNVPGGFNFTGAPPTFNFTDGNAGTAPPQRKIKKAFRRTTQR
ncbi:Nuclear pore complex protein Nup153-like Protein [Tribolium castaneum]|uniref:Nuclear pore complex protein Nup153 n=1 Tax=Tribolium castaneum TaxID=7070 RepID=A0A139WL08_TRICA|nr:Nuclear pore complex protein Nup153-like Protein [Tribolium castaneum]